MDLLVDWLRDRVPGPVAAGGGDDPVTLVTADVVDQEGGPSRRTIVGGASRWACSPGSAWPRQPAP